MIKYLSNYFRTLRFKKILGNIDIPKSGAILDISCSDGVFLSLLHGLSPDLKLFGVDISNNGIRKASADFPFANFSEGNADRLNYPNNFFDCIFSIMSLHHYENSNDFITEVFRVLKQDGSLYLIDIIPKYSWTQKVYNWKGCPEPYHFEKFYTIHNLESVLEKNGLRIREKKRVFFIPRIKLFKIQRS